MNIYIYQTTVIWMQRWENVESNRWPRLRTVAFSTVAIFLPGISNLEPKIKKNRKKSPYVACYERWGGGLVGWLGLWATFRHVCHGKKITVPLAWKLGFLNISGYLARYGIQMDPSVTERRQQSGKKPVLCMLGQLSTIIRGRERADQESAYDGKIAQAI